jgi:hypothetical protein
VCGGGGGVGGGGRFLISDKECVVENVSCIPKSVSVLLRGHLKRAAI